MTHAVAGVARASDPDRQVPRGRRRARRRRGRRRDRRGRHRRHHGAHRGGRHPLRRQLLRRPAVQGRRPARRAIRDYTRRIARALKVVGLMNAQFAIKDDTVYVLEVNPRASRTVPYLSKATGVPLAKVAARLMIGRTLAQLGLTEDLEVSGVLRQDAGVPVRAVPRRRHDSRAGDEVDRRGHGRRGDLRQRLRQGAAGRRAAAAAEGHRVHQRQQPRQAGGRADRARPARARLQAGRDARHRELPARARPRRGDRLQGQRRAARTSATRS